MQERRITIPKILLDKSNLKGETKIIFILEDSDIVLIPYTEDWGNLKVIDVKAIEEKGRITFPKNIKMSTDEILIFLENKEIKIRRCP